MLFYWRKLSY